MNPRVCIGPCPFKATSQNANTGVFVNSDFLLHGRPRRSQVDHREPWLWPHAPAYLIGEAHRESEQARKSPRVTELKRKDLHGPVEGNDVSHHRGCTGHRSGHGQGDDQ